MPGSSRKAWISPASIRPIATIEPEDLGPYCT